MAHRQDHYLARLCSELGLAVNDYNRCQTDKFEEIVKLTLAYLNKVQINVKGGNIPEDELVDYFAIIGQTWAGIIPRINNEYEEYDSVPEAKAAVTKIPASSLPLPLTTSPVPHPPSSPEPIKPSQTVSQPQAKPAGPPASPAPAKPAVAAPALAPSPSKPPAKK